MNAAKRLEIFRRLHEDNPEPKTELAYSNPFELLVAVTLSAQATDVSVNKATAKLFPVANTPEAIYALGVEGLSEYIKTIGNAAALGQIGFRNPVDVALGQRGLLYVLNHAAENTPNGKRVAKCTIDEEDFLGEFGTFGAGDGQFSWPNSLAKCRPLAVLPMRG